MLNDLLRELGFSDYEARAYISLVGAQSLNGYEVAKAAGMPRANVYNVLDKLTQRGAVKRMQAAKGVRYTATRPADLMRQIDRHHGRTLAKAEKALTQLETAPTAAPVFNLDGYDTLMAQTRAMIDAAEQDLLIAVQPAEAAVLAPTLREARRRGVSITTLCMAACQHECGGCQGRVHRYNFAGHRDERWLLLVCDGTTAQAGEISLTKTTSISTEHGLIVELITGYIHQSLALAIVADDVGEQFEGLLSGQARQALNTLQPDGQFLTRLMEVTAVQKM